jgi:probable rRNA maturation factor
MQLQLYFEEEFDNVGDLGSLVNEVAEAVRSLFGSSVAEEWYNIIVASEDLVRSLNRDFRNNDAVTDVLSFPLGDEDEITGEIYICWTRVKSQAIEYGNTVHREFCFLLVHGILHLLGYDHDDEPNPEMRALEEKILERINLRRV